MSTETENIPKRHPIKAEPSDRAAIATSQRHRAKIARALLDSNLYWNECVWTFLVADILARKETRHRALSILCGRDLTISEPFAIWVEAQPISPRKGSRKKTERNSRIDLAFGDIARRNETEAGIEHAPRDGSWVCFVEAKLLADCSTTVTHDPARNQLARVIESLLTFQAKGRFPEQLIFTLLTPKYFHDQRRRSSRLYGYKIHEYDSDKEALLRDITLADDTIPRREDTGTWRYPPLAERCQALRIHWATYEEIFDLDPGLAGLDLVKVAREHAMEDRVRARLNAIIDREVAASAQAGPPVHSNQSSVSSTSPAQIESEERSSPIVRRSNTDSATTN